MSLTVEKCLQAWTNSLKQMKVIADIVFFGDSHIYYGNFSPLFPRKVVCNLGLRGDTVQGMIERVEQVASLEPKMVFLMAGINDVASCSIDLFENRYELLINHLLKQVPGVKIIIQSILPVNDIQFDISCNNNQIVYYNKVIERLARERHLHFINLYHAYVNNGLLPEEYTTDGIHLNDNAYGKWYEEIRKNIV